MPSRAISKGPTLDPRLKRLAMPTATQTMVSWHCGGVLEEGPYGAGAAMVWESGHLRAEVERAQGKGIREELCALAEAEAAMQEGLEAGTLQFRLQGHKLQGLFALVRTGSPGKEAPWLHWSARWWLYAKTAATRWRIPAQP
jgi:bifunctional non-homologous end joining protein LigD